MACRCEGLRCMSPEVALFGIDDRQARQRRANLSIPPYAMHLRLQNTSRRSEEARLAFKIPACLRPRPTPLLAEILQRDLNALVVHALELSLEPFPTLGAA